MKQARISRIYTQRERQAIAALRERKEILDRLILILEKYAPRAA